ncbi:hypothetical protein E2542_SST00134 [Spatholobus suberectus]|nr:hypothetical protein E2542_SST00134 [Spatholobus suberectus]
MASVASHDVINGPVKSLISKRLRTLRKKLNCILAIIDKFEKLLNKKQEQVLRSKPSVLDLINKFEKLHQPLAFALTKELKSTMQSRVGFASTMLTWTHECRCCLTYDYVTNDATDLLSEKDLDSISMPLAKTTLHQICTSKPLQIRSQTQRRRGEEEEGERRS